VEKLLITPQFELLKTAEGYIVKVCSHSEEFVLIGPEPDTVRGLANALKMAAMVLEGKLKLRGSKPLPKIALARPIAPVLKLFK
jgi:hypothetical protein